MSLGSRVNQAVRFVVHNWPLKLAAIALATLLYAGLVASQDSSVFPGPVAVLPINKPDGTVVTNDLRDLDQIRYIAPLDVGRLRAEDFEATVDLSNVKPDGQQQSVRVAVNAVDPRVTILDFQPRAIQVVLDEVTTKQVPVDVQQGPTPEGVDVGEVVYTPTEVSVTGASTAVSRVVAARVVATLDPEGIDFDRDVEARPVDDSGQIVAGVELDPRTVHVTIPLFTNRQSRTLPVDPVVTGTPAQGFRIASVAADPLVVSVEGDADQLAALMSADTAPVSVSGATRDVTVEVPLALPSGVVAVGAETVQVSVHVEALTETRTYSAGIRLDGREPDLDYAVSASQVLLTLFGPVADLDRLGSAPIVVGVNVAGLAPGSHELPVVPSLPSTLTLVEVSPDTVTVTIAVPATQAPAASGAAQSPAAPDGGTTSPAP
jgi:YbbR domain-containing protein